MKKSSQLESFGTCANNPNANISVNKPEITMAIIQKKVIKRALMGEPINIASELYNAFDKDGKVWGSNTNRDEQIEKMAKNIERFVYFENFNRDRANKLFKKDINNGQPIVVDYFGEEVEVNPDYFVETDDTVYVCKVKTGAFKEKDDYDLASQEAYCFGLAGEQIANGRNVEVQYLYLKDASAETEEQTLQKVGETEYLIPYDSDEPKYRHIKSADFNEEMKRDASNAHDEIVEEKSKGCVPGEQCGGCPMENICVMELPPIPADVEDVVHRDWEAIENQLSNAQRNVIGDDTGISVVNAGPGSGKTLVTSMRVSKLVEKNFDPEKICLLTFTKAGAGEMTARSVDYSAYRGTPIDPDKFTSTTFNAFCHDIIGKYHRLLGFTAAPIVVKEERKRGIVNRMFDQFPKISCWNYNVNPQNITYAKQESNASYTMAIKEFEKIKTNKWGRNTIPDEFKRDDYGHLKYTDDDLDILFLMYDEYNEQLKEKNLVDYIDQLNLVEKLIEIKPDLFTELGYEHIIVDEFQDTDEQQTRLLNKMIDTPQFKSLMCVGDDAQSIYKFRGATPYIMTHFDEFFGRHNVYNLLNNHRSPRKVIEYANFINEKSVSNLQKDLVPAKTEDGMPMVQGFYTIEQEYEWIANSVKEKWEAGERDIAVIMSERSQLSAIADKLTKLGVPSNFKSPIFVNQNARIRALTTFYDAFFGKGTQGFLDYRNIIENGGLKGKSANELDVVIDEFKNNMSGVEKTVSVFMEFARALDENQKDECYKDFIDQVKDCRDVHELKEFFEDFKVYGKFSTYTNSGAYSGVTLTTVHSSKGLEWDTTFLCLDNVYKDSFENSSSKLNGSYDEGIRTWFVGATRAKENLIVSGLYYTPKYFKDQTSKSRNMFKSAKARNGRGVALKENEFLKETYKFCGKIWDMDNSKRLSALEDARNNKIADTLKKDNVPVMGKGSGISERASNAVVMASKAYNVERGE